MEDLADEYSDLKREEEEDEEGKQERERFWRERWVKKTQEREREILER